MDIFWICNFGNRYNTIKVENKEKNDIKDASQKRLEFTKKKEVFVPLLSVKDKYLNEDLSTQLKDRFKNITDENHLNKILNLYLEIEQFYRQVEGWNTHVIRQWLEDEKTNPVNPKLIAVIKRAHFIFTEQSLRDTQILSLLCFLTNSSSKGCLAQIATSEGKSIIIASLAVSLALQGYHVDIITSSPVLAERDAQARVDFFALFGLTVAHNGPAPDYITGPKKCYESDIVYGSIGNFQFDYLLDTHKGRNTRNQRKLTYVIVDEVDSMLIDDGGHIAKLSGSFPGMEYLNGLLMIIWHKVNEMDKALGNDLADCNISEAARKIQEKMDTSKESIRAEIINVINTQQFSLPGSEKTQSLLLPACFKPFALQQTAIWIENAIRAKYFYKENHEYVIKKVNHEKVVIPVDFSNTGVFQQNTLLSGGLHQFLQIKHGLPLSSELLTGCYISNIGYLKKYGCIFGLTGTLGAKVTQDFLVSTYGVNLFFMPTYKEKQFKLLEPYLATEHIDWLYQIAADSLCRAENGQAVLIICETIADTHHIKTVIEESLVSLPDLKNSCPIQITHYWQDEDTKCIAGTIVPGQIIIATNLSGRGTDLAIDKQIDEGLHVCLAFLPNNHRVKEQAFGRTARQGRKGTGQLIVNLKKIAANEVNNNTLDVEKILEERETKAIRLVIQHQLAALTRNDALFEKYSEICCKLRAAKENDPLFYYRLEAFDEYWALWLFSLEGKRVDGTVEDLFNGFLSRALTPNKTDIKDDIIQNPYYWTHMGITLINNRQFSEAIDKLKKAISLEKKLCFSAHYHLGIAYIESTGAIWARLKEALVELPFPFLSLKMPSWEKIQWAHDAFSEAKQALIGYQGYLTAMGILANKNAGTMEYDYLLHYITSKLSLANLYTAHINAVMDFLNSQNENYIAISRNYSLNLEELGQEVSPSQTQVNIQKIKKAILGSAVQEMAFLGLYNLVELKVVYPVANEILHGIRGQILAGLAIFPLGFLPIPGAQFAFSIAATLIAEGVCDLIAELISQGEQAFNLSSYLKGKAISYGASALTGGIVAICKSATFLNKAISICQKLVDKLRQVKGIWEKVACQIATYITKCIAGLQQVLAAVNRAALVSQQMSTQLKCVQAVAQISKTVFTDVTLLILNEKITHAVLDAGVSLSKEAIYAKVKTTLSHKLAIGEVALSQTLQVEKDANALLYGTNNVILSILGRSGMSLLKQAHPNLKVGTMLLEQALILKAIATCVDIFCESMNIKYGSDIYNKEGERFAKKEDIIARLSLLVADRIHNYIIQCASTIVTQAVMAPMVDAMADKLGHGIINLLNVKNDSKMKEVVLAKNSVQGADNTDYEILGLSSNASQTEMKAAYYKLALQYHPDRETGDLDKFQRIQNAYERLSQNKSKPSHVKVGPSRSHGFFANRPVKILPNHSAYSSQKATEPTNAKKNPIDLKPYPVKKHSDIYPSFYDKSVNQSEMGDQPPPYSPPQSRDSIISSEMYRLEKSGVSIQDLQALASLSKKPIELSGFLARGSDREVQGFYYTQNPNNTIGHVQPYINGQPINFPSRLTSMPGNLCAIQTAVFYDNYEANNHITNIKKRILNAVENVTVEAIEEKLYQLGCTTLPDEKSKNLNHSEVKCGAPLTNKRKRNNDSDDDNDIPSKKGYLRTRAELTENALKPSGKDEILKTSEIERWIAYSTEEGKKSTYKNNPFDYKDVYFAIRVPTESITFSINLKSGYGVRGHSGALFTETEVNEKNNLEFKQERATEGQFAFHAERQEEVLMATNAKDAAKNGLIYTINNTIGLGRCKDESLFEEHFYSTGGQDIHDPGEREVFYKKVQMDRDIWKLIANELSNEPLIQEKTHPNRPLSPILSRRFSFFRQQENKIKAAKTIEDLGKILQTPTPYPASSSISSICQGMLDQRYFY